MGVTVTSQVFVRNGFGRFAALCADAGEDTVDRVLDQGEVIARGEAPYDTGELEGGIRAVKLSRTSGAIRSTAPHTMPQEEGATDHDIPRSFGRPSPWGFGRAWLDSGRSLSHGGPMWHPGNKPQPFLRPALAYMKGALMRVARQEYPG